MWYINLVTAFTNCVALYPAMCAYHFGDPDTALLIGITALCSFFSHLFESHKHGLYGFGTPPVISFWLNRLDVFMAFVLFARVCYLVYERNFIKMSDLATDIIIGLVFFLCNVISESDTAAETQRVFFLFHNIWHVGIFIELTVFLNKLYMMKE